jgi:hypothetical protein
MSASRFLPLIAAILIAMPLRVLPEKPSLVTRALDALRSDPKATFRVDDGWTIVTTQVGADTILWSFTPTSHPAYPAAVRRTVREENGVVHIDMEVLCESTQAHCDALALEFRQLNEDIGKSLGDNDN